MVERTRKKIVPFLRWETFLLIQTVKEFLLCLKNVTYGMWCVCVCVNKLSLSLFLSYALFWTTRS